MVENYNNVLLRKVNIVDWESQAARQASEEFGLEAIPYIRVYGTNGELLGEVPGADIQAIDDLVRKEAN